MGLFDNFAREATAASQAGKAGQYKQLAGTFAGEAKQAFAPFQQKAMQDIVTGQFELSPFRLNLAKRSGDPGFAKAAQDLEDSFKSVNNLRSQLKTARRAETKTPEDKMGQRVTVDKLRQALKQQKKTLSNQRGSFNKLVPRKDELLLMGKQTADFVRLQQRGLERHLQQIGDLSKFMNKGIMNGADWDRVVEHGIGAVFGATAGLRKKAGEPGALIDSRKVASSLGALNNETIKTAIDPATGTILRESFNYNPRIGASWTEMYQSYFKNDIQLLPKAIDTIFGEHVSRMEHRLTAIDKLAVAASKSKPIAEARKVLQKYINNDNIMPRKHVKIGTDAEVIATIQLLVSDLVNVTQDLSVGSGLSTMLADDMLGADIARVLDGRKREKIVNPRYSGTGHFINAIDELKTWNPNANFPKIYDIVASAKDSLFTPMIKNKLMDMRLQTLENYWENYANRLRDNIEFDNIKSLQTAYGIKKKDNQGVSIIKKIKERVGSGFRSQAEFNRNK